MSSLEDKMGNFKCACFPLSSSITSVHCDPAYISTPLRPCRKTKKYSGKILGRLMMKTQKPNLENATMDERLLSPLLKVICFLTFTKICQKK